MPEPDEILNWRLALDEANKYMRQIDNYFWAISSFVTAGTGFAILEALEMNGENYKVIILSCFMSLVWLWYRWFLRDTMTKIIFYQTRANFYEEKLGIDILPETVSEIYEQKIIKKFFPYTKQLKKGKARTFFWVMNYMVYLSWVIWLLFVIELIVKNWCDIYAFIEPVLNYLTI